VNVELIFAHEGQFSELMTSVTDATAADAELVGVDDAEMRLVFDEEAEADEVEDEEEIEEAEDDDCV
jgi:hypothetical protein